MDNNVDEIKRFVSKRPDVIAAYGYGSGIFKQSGYTEKDKPQIDLILVVDNLKKWHKENITLNKGDYSLIGKLFFKHGSISCLKGTTGITYVSNIVEDGRVFKYGTIEEEDLKKYLVTWESFYIPGRFQKSIYPIKEDKNLLEFIEKNRENAFLLSSYLQEQEDTNMKTILTTLCGLSYLGDTRMKFAENPRKVLNIVEGNFEELNNIYNKNYSFVKNNKKDNIKLDFGIIKNNLDSIPQSLLDYIGEEINSSDDIIRHKIIEYFTQLNKKESSTQTIKGIYTNGIVRSVKYASKKVLKKLKHY